MSSAQPPSLAARVASFPGSPGVYLMKNRAGKIIYVGKAKNLSARVRSYLQRPEALDPKTAALMRAAASIDYIAVDSEVEALVLECTLIKEHRPRYNIRLKDDKRYPYLKLTLGEAFPRLLLVRTVENDGSEYFGPFTDARAVRRTLRSIREIFALRDCGTSPGRTPGRECLNFHIGRCSAPCTGRVGEEEYRAAVERVRLFLKGRRSAVAEAMRERMWRLSAAKRYEEAAAARDQLAAFEEVTARRRAVRPGGEDEDVAAIARDGPRAFGVIIKVRDGRILAQESFALPVSEHDREADVFEAFFELYYHSTTDIPPRIVAAEPLAEAPLAERWLGGKTGRRVRVVVPRRGERRSLVELARKNAALQLASAAGARGAADAALAELRTALGLGRVPRRIEAYDISNIQGSEAVGSRVTFENGRPLKSAYRQYRIRTVAGSDDYAMMREVLSRRLARLGRGPDRPPDLILVDGGAGQVAAARAALDDIGAPPMPLIGLAKRREEIHREGAAGPLRLPRRSAGLKLLQRIRDEAHRFAVSYHRSLRGRRMRRSELDDVPGVGEKRRTALLVAFGSVQAIRAATVDRIAAVPGIGRALAESIHEHLSKKAR